MVSEVRFIYNIIETWLKQFLDIYHLRQTDNLCAKLNTQQRNFDQFSIEWSSLDFTDFTQGFVSWIVFYTHTTVPIGTSGYLRTLKLGRQVYNQGIYDILWLLKKLWIWTQEAWKPWGNSSRAAEQAASWGGIQSEADQCVLLSERKLCVLAGRKYTNQNNNKELSKLWQFLQQLSG